MSSAEGLTSATGHHREGSEFVTTSSGEVSAPTTRPKDLNLAPDVIKILEAFYAKKQHLKRATEKEISDLKVGTKLTEAQIQNWFHNKHKNAPSDAKKKIHSSIAVGSDIHTPQHNAVDGGIVEERTEEEQREIDKISEYLAVCKSRLAKEHREKQEEEWDANKLKIASYLETFRAKKRELSRTGRLAHEDATRRVATKQDSASSPSSSSSSSSSQTGSQQADVPTERAAFSYSSLYFGRDADDGCGGGKGKGEEGEGHRGQHNPASVIAISNDFSTAVMQENADVSVGAGGRSGGTGLER